MTLKRVIYLKVFILFVSTIDAGFMNMPRFKISIEDIIISEVNDDYFKVDIKFYNAKTTKATIDLKCDVWKDIPTTTKVRIAAKKQTEKDMYIAIGVPVEKSLCEYIEQDKMIYPGILKYGNFVKKCPISTGDYYLKNYTIDTEHFPMVLPIGNYHIEYGLNDLEAGVLIKGYVSINVEN